MRFTVTARTVGSHTVGDIMLDGRFFAQAKSEAVATKIATYLESRGAFDWNLFRQQVPHFAKVSFITATSAVPKDCYRS